MKHISEVTLQQALDAAQPAVEPERVDLDPDAQRVVIALFRELKAIFPAWRNAWPAADDEAAARRSWIKAFASAGLRNLEQIRFGVEQCRQSGRPFMPSVGEFIQWCQPSPQAMGCPTVEQAYLQACALAHPAADRENAHPAVWHAASEVGLYELANLPTDRSRPMFERAYGMTLDMLVKGQPLRSIPKALPATVHVQASPERARSALDEIRTKLRGVA
ncbi:MAG: Replication protein P [Gammaproteobacteria bacterium]|nr:Replication protein P [Gammaproteobacteria bacterium]